MTDAHLDHEVDAAPAGDDAAEHPAESAADGDAALRDAIDRAEKLQRRLDAVQALLAEERAQAAEQAAGRGHVTGYEEAAALRDDLAAVRAQLAAVQKELRAVRASSTWRAGLAVKRVAAPAVAARRRALRAVRTLRGTSRRTSGRTGGGRA